MSGKLTPLPGAIGGMTMQCDNLVTAEAELETRRTGKSSFHFRVLAEIPQVISCQRYSTYTMRYLLLSYLVLVLYCSYQQTTHQSSMSNTQHVFTPIPPHNARN